MVETTLDKGAIEAVAALATPEIVQATILADGVSFPIAAIRGKDGFTNIVDLRAERAKWLRDPDRRTGCAVTDTLGSFIDLVNRHKDSDSAIFAALLGQEPHLLAVIDYHPDAQELDPRPAARFCQHRVKYPFPLSQSWKEWSGIFTQAMAQGAFAEFIEDHIADLATPDAAEKEALEPKMLTKFGTPADVMKLSRGLSVQAETKVIGAVVLQSGEREIAFEESHKSLDGKPLKVPGLVLLNIRMFEGGAFTRVVLRLRYRLAGGKVLWMVDPYNLRETTLFALREEVGKVVVGTGLPVYEGKPES